jgi:hypothetical protein
MTDIVLQHDVASLGSLLRLTAAATAVAAGSGDSSTTTGATIDRFGSFSGSMPETFVFAVPWDATLATGKTLSIGYAVQTSDDGSSWTDFQTATYAVVGTGSTAASVLAGTFQVGVDLTAARRYVRSDFALDLSNTGTDTAAARGVGFFAGFDRLPQ